MPVFATPGPISVTIDLYAGTVRLIASDRADTVVEVRPSDESDDSDVKAAQKTRVEHADGALTVRGPRARALDFSRKTRSVDVLIELPEGSAVHSDVTAGDVRGTGSLGVCRFSASLGHFQLDRVDSLRLTTSAGHVTVGAVAGDAEVSTGTGRVRLGAVGGCARVKNSNGHTEMGPVAGELRVRSANGDISIDRAESTVDARTACGAIRVDGVVRGSVALSSAAGDLEVGVVEGTAAWLDLNTGHGRVRNELTDAASGPERSEETVEVRASTSYGDITVRRS
ncbi:DUF4097 family beta strand repeat-containing protein [Actinokineospora pegani]|uniref:DUF4097 family beta strand repeat-containing protein n=1 Tax=Actinokineospora pegani TaxID=2654637 RepID=UPI0012E9DAC8|nr:DUF4097 family beta strand repeat-containing protein [Actinokineospora pegani]